MRIVCITRFCSLLVFLFATFSMSLSAQQAEPDVPRVVFVLNNNSGNYLPVLKGFREYSRKQVGRLIHIELINNEEHTPAALNEKLTGNFDVVVAIGEQSTRDVIATGTELPLFSLKVNQSVLRALHKSAVSNNRVVTGIYRDQPFERFASMIKESMPQYQRVGLLLSQKTKNLKPQFDTIMQTYGLTPVVNIVKGNDLPQRVLERLAKRSDVIVAIFDDNVYSQTNVKSHLLTAFRHQIPVIGVTRNYTEIGAIASLYTDSFDLGQQTAKHVLKLVDLDDKSMQPIYPESFMIRINYNVMRSFGISAIEQNELKKDIQQSTKETGR